MLVMMAGLWAEEAWLVMLMPALLLLLLGGAVLQVVRVGQPPPLTM